MASFNPKNRKIVIVDDEIRADTPEIFGSYMSLYIDELTQAEYAVFPFDNVDNAYDFMKATPDISLLILDIMMPPGKLFRETETHRGLQTGIHFIKLCLQENRNFSIFILTNAPVKTLRKNELADCDINRLPLILAKPEVTPGELLDKVNDYFKSA